MSGIDPYVYMQTIAARMHELDEPAEIEKVLDELEYLFEVIPPDLQPLAEPLIAQLRDKLGLTG